jgi:hypothetical protein
MQQPGSNSRLQKIAPPLTIMHCRLPFKDPNSRPLWRPANTLIMVRNELHKEMLKMKIAPQSLLKTKGQKKCSSEFIENKEVSILSR